VIVHMACTILNTLSTNVRGFASLSGMLSSSSSVLLDILLIDNSKAKAELMCLRDKADTVCSGWFPNLSQKMLNLTG
jgi:hypothetical protein